MEPRIERSEGRRRPPKKVTEAALQRWAQQHLRRYPATVFQLKRVLLRRIRRSLDHYGGDRDEALSWLDALLGRLEEAGLLDDRRIARLWVEDLHRRGTSTRLLRVRLRQKGVPSLVVDEVLAELASSPDFEMAAAVAYARRRRLGAFHVDPERRRERREKDLRSLMRRGFGPSTARAAVDGESEELDLRFPPS